MRSLWIIACLACLASPAAAERVTAPKCAEAVPNRPAARNVKQVDWCNHDGGTWKGALRAGHSSLHMYRKLGQPHDTISHSLRGVVYGDFDGDHEPEAAIVIEKTTWVAGREPSNWWSVHLYTFANGAPKLIDTVGVGKPVHEIKLGGKTLVVTSGTPKVTTRFRRDAKSGELVEITP